MYLCSQYSKKQYFKVDSELFYHGDLTLFTCYLGNYLFIFSFYQYTI